MHVSKNVITLWEDGTKIPREDDITFLCSLYGIDRIDLMNTTDNKTSKKNSRKGNTKHRNIIVSIIMIFISVIVKNHNQTNFITLFLLYQIFF